MKQAITELLLMLKSKAAENVAAGMTVPDAVNAALNRLELEYPTLIEKLKEALA